jgi:hypothetical protein
MIADDQLCDVLVQCYFRHDDYKGLDRQLLHLLKKKLRARDANSEYLIGDNHLISS